MLSRPTIRWFQVWLLLAAVGCNASIDASPWLDQSTGVPTSDGKSDAMTDAGSSTSPAPDASLEGTGDAPRVDGGSPPLLRDAATADSATNDNAPSNTTIDASMAPSAPSVEQVGPPAQEPLPDCPTSPITFDTPPPAAATGLVAIDLSSWLQPTGFRERAIIHILDAQSQPDTGYRGELVWTLPEGLEIVDAKPIDAGVAEVTFRFKHAGSYALDVSLKDDARTGHAEVIAYDTQLPVWELAADPSALAMLYDAPGGDAVIPAVLTIEAMPHQTKLQLHGGSSRYYPKKSFRIDVADADAWTPPYGKKLILRAEYNDKSQLRNWLALRLLRASTSLPMPRSKLVHFRVNDRYYGVMHNVERIGKPFLREWGMSDTGSLYESDPPLELATPGGNLTPLSPEMYPMVYQHQAGTIDYTDLRTLIEDTLTLPDSEFEAIAETELMMDEYIQYLAGLAAIQDQDQVRKNFYLYRDPNKQAGWRVLPWDLDLTFGHLWSQENDVLEEKIVTDSDIYVGAYDPARGGFYNQLTDRVLRVPAYRARFRALVEHMLSTTMTRTQADMLLQAAIRCATPDMVGDLQKRAENAEYQGRVTEILGYLDARLAFVRGLPQ